MVHIDWNALIGDTMREFTAWIVPMLIGLGFVGLSLNFCIKKLLKLIFSK